MLAVLGDSTKNFENSVAGVITNWQRCIHWVYPKSHFPVAIEHDARRQFLRIFQEVQHFIA